MRETARGILAVVAATLFAAACGGGDGPTPPDPQPPANRAPVANPSVTAATLVEGVSMESSLASEFSDPDGDALTYSGSSSDQAVATVSVAGSTGTVTAVSAGTATVTFTATDPGGLSASFQMSITVEAANRPPEVVGTVANANLAAGESRTIEAADLFSDPDGDELAFSASSSDDSVATAAADGSSVTVTAVAEGSASVTITAADPAGASVDLAFGVNVEAANAAPEVSDTIPAQSATAGDTITLDLADHFSDPDGDDLAYGASTSDSDVAAASVAGSELSVVAAGAGSAEVTVTATDPEGLSASQSFGITVAAPPPVLADSIPTHDMIVDSMVSLDLSAYLEGDDLTYAVTSSDEMVASSSVAGMTMSTTGTGAVEDSISTAYLTVTATNSGGEVTQDSIMVRVHQQAYDTLPGISVTDDGNLSASLGGNTVSLSICLNLENFPVDGLFFTVYWSEWQRAVGGGWVTVQNNVRTGPPRSNICPINIEDDKYPPGIYRMAGHLKIGDDVGFYRTQTIEKRAPGS